mmetsp:Transcript_23056/g.35684  ORF Transcript_23056/g.35684 Transcript_23056/m.35684 type:complete len:81 (-) Transcript_23056:124-366(-)
MFLRDHSQFRCEGVITLIRDSINIKFKDTADLEKTLVDNMNKVHCSRFRDRLDDTKLSIYKTHMTKSYMQVRCKVKSCRF